MANEDHDPRWDQTGGIVGGCAHYQDGRRLQGRLSPFEAAALSRTTSGFVWIGLRQPSAGDIAEIARAFDLPPLAVEDAVSAHQRPKLELYGDVAFVVLKPVDYAEDAEEIDVSELAVFVGRGFVVTVRHGPTDVVAATRTEFDEGSDVAELGPAGVLYRLADRVVDRYEDVIALMGEDIDEVESQVFDDTGADHVERIYNLKREISRLRRAVLPLTRPLERLSTGAVPRTEPEAMPYFRDVLDHVHRAADAIEGHDRLLIDILQADLAMTGIRQSEIAMQQNEDMRKISAWAAIALVPTATAGIYGMNFSNMPELHWRYGYFLILGIIAGICILLYWAFRRNGWLGPGAGQDH